MKTNTAESNRLLIGKLPDLPPSKKHLLEIVQKGLKNRNVAVNKPAEFPICPDCGNPYEYLYQQVVDEEGYPIVITSCPACGWIQGMELPGKNQTLLKSDFGAEEPFARALLATEWNIPGHPGICTLILAILFGPRIALLAGNSRMMHL
ncbi:MAG: hypothetical protein K9K82_05710 [Desulfobacteraceae bacterium]|nr:hypothetical protein [Desulfobacteraceae bacterium]